tara:strand:+ start:4269 stop:4763 length:495 start_codon:yes stop_codon:yes gene_type:complete
MSRRTDITNQLRIDLSSIAIASSQLKTIDEINDWPYITFTPSTERRTHIGAGKRIGTLTYLVRGYTFSDGVASMEAAELLGRQIEELVDSFRSTHFIFSDQNLTTQELAFLVTQANEIIRRQQQQQYLDLGVISMYVSSIRTDEGVMSPYGIVDLTVECSYFVN